MEQVIAVSLVRLIRKALIIIPVAPTLAALLRRYGESTRVLGWNYAGHAAPQCGAPR
jgi:hypothetical protein